MAAIKALPEFSQISPNRRFPGMAGDSETVVQEVEEVVPAAEETITYHVYTDASTTSFQNFQTLVEVSARVAEGEDRADGIQITWEQDNVKHLQDALNSQPGISSTDLQTLHQQGEIQVIQTLPEDTILPNLTERTVIRSLSSDSGVPAVGEETVLCSVEDAQSVQFVQTAQDLSTTSAVGVSKPTYLRQRTKPIVRRRRRDGVSPSEEDDLHRPCNVCGGEAGKHSYYGGQVCPSCRAFFRRSVTSGANKTYFCVKNGQCEVTCKTRKQCQYCRYKLCEEAGMKTSWVLTDAAKPLRNGEGRTKRKSQDVDDPVEEPAAAETRHVFITETELTLINELVDISDFWETSKVNDMDTTLIREIIRMVAFGATLSEGGLKQLAATMKLRARKVALRLREMQQLSNEDREEILSKNIPILIKLKISTFFNPELTWCKQLSGLLGTGEVEKLDRKLKSLKVEGLESLRLKYSQFFSSPFLQSEEAEQEFCKLLNKIGSWPEDEKEYILMCILLLFCPDLLNLQDRARVEQIQTSLAQLLHNYLNYRHGRERGRSKFASAMFLVSRCRQLHDILHRNKIDLST